MKKIIIGIFLFIASFFPVTFSDYSLPIVSSLAIVAFALPSYYFLIKKEKKKAIFTIITISIFAIIIETIGIATGLPYSEFFYGEELGFKLFGLTPWTVFFAFTPLVLGAVFYTKKFLGKNNFSIKKFFILSTAILVIIDLILDPVAVKLGFWFWVEEGIYYGIPLQNYFGWILSGFIATLIYYYFNKTNIVEGQELSLYYSIWFYTGASFFLGLLIPFLIGIILIILFTNVELIKTIFYNKKII